MCTFLSHSLFLSFCLSLFSLFSLFSHTYSTTQKYRQRHKHTFCPWHSQVSDGSHVWLCLLAESELEKPQPVHVTLDSVCVCVCVCVCVWVSVWVRACLRLGSALER